MPAFARNLFIATALSGLVLTGCRSGIPDAGRPGESKPIEMSPAEFRAVKPTTPAANAVVQVAGASDQISPPEQPKSGKKLQAIAARFVMNQRSSVTDLPVTELVDTDEFARQAADSDRNEDAATTSPGRDANDAGDEPDQASEDNDSSANESRKEAMSAFAPMPDTFDDAGAESAERPLTLVEAIQVSLSHNKSILVLGHAPREAATFCSSEQAAFDPVFEAGVAGGKTDRQLSNFVNSGGLTPTNEQQTDFFRPVDRNQLSLSKLLETGGTVEAGVATDYLFQDPVGGFALINPAWRSALNFRLTQPLGRGRGSDVTTAPLRIAQVNHRQATHQFRSRVNLTLRDVQLAYWDWKLAQQQMIVRQQAVEQAAESVEQEKQSLKLGDGTLPDVQQAEDQLQRFRIELTFAKNVAEQNKIALANVMGVLPAEAPFDFAIDQPMIYTEPVLEIGEATARLRPEMMAVSAQIKAAELGVHLANDNLRPDLNMRFDYAVSGLDDRLDDSLETVFDNQYNDWALQFEYRRAAGQRAERALLSRSRVRLSRLLAERRQVEQEIQTQVARAWQDIETSRSVMDLQIRRVEIAAEQVKGRETLYREGEGTLDQKIRAEATLVEAVLAKIQSEIALQQAVVRWEYATGQQHHVEFAGQ
ncbi:TolC family protein [Planctomycetes bacterium K23_9]|uniref:Outer membrane efflux protein n=1 Tax=Stieleria marina TaxID=1930275 RepID=A0A517NNT2_9BACT|nr:Outer membrane efflux protein [Planctomycetes bacterium K23_9]